MATLHHNTQQQQALSPPSKSRWVWPFCLGIIGLGILLLLVPRAKVPPPADPLRNAVTHQGPTGAPPSARKNRGRTGILQLLWSIPSVQVRLAIPARTVRRF